MYQRWKSSIHFLRNFSRNFLLIFFSNSYRDFSQISLAIPSRVIFSHNSLEKYSMDFFQNWCMGSNENISRNYIQNISNWFFFRTFLQRVFKKILHWLFITSCMNSFWFAFYIFDQKFPQIIVKFPFKLLRRMFQKFLQRFFQKIFNGFLWKFIQQYLLKI